MAKNIIGFIYGVICIYFSQIYQPEVKGAIG